VGRRVDFVFGLGSRYSYLASTQLAGIAGRTGCVFEWLPVSSVELMAARGTSPFKGKSPSGQYDWAYRRRDAEDWASYYGVPFVEPEPPPEDHQLMAMAVRTAEEQGALEPYAKALFEAVFVHHVKVDEDACISIGRDLGLDTSRYQRTLADPKTRDKVSADALAAVARGVFGVPSFLVGGHMFWGNDRLVLLEHWLLRNP